MAFLNIQSRQEHKRRVKSILITLDIAEDHVRLTLSGF